MKKKMGNIENKAKVETLLENFNFGKTRCYSI